MYIYIYITYQLRAWADISDHLLNACEKLEQNSFLYTTADMRSSHYHRMRLDNHTDLFHFE